MDDSIQTTEDSMDDTLAPTDEYTETSMDDYTETSMDDHTETSAIDDSTETSAIDDSMDDYDFSTTETVDVDVTFSSTQPTRKPTSAVPEVSVDLTYNGLNSANYPSKKPAIKSTLSAASG